MKKTALMTLILSLVFIVACASAEKPASKPATAPATEPLEGAGAGSNDMLVEQMNKQLEKVPFEGFAYKSAEVPAYKYNKWASAAAPVLKGIIDKLPANHVLQVTGHTDTAGPEDAEKGKAGNIKLSEKRAKAVYDALKSKGIKSPKMTYKGVGSSMPKSGVDGKSAEQRRVTFQVVPE